MTRRFSLRPFGHRHGSGRATPPESGVSPRLRRSRLLLAALLLTGFALLGILWRVVTRTATLVVDVVSSEPAEVRIDGASSGTVPPLGLGIFRVAPGIRAVEVSQGGRMLDAGSVSVTSRRTTVLVVGRRARYVRERVGYTEGDPTFPGFARGYDDLTGQRTVEADFGPSEPVPDEIRVTAGTSSQELVRTKLWRLPPETQSATEACLFVLGGAKHFLARGSDYIPAIHGLLEGPPEENSLPAILACLEKDEVALSETGFPALWKTTIKIPDSALSIWVAGLGKPGDLAAVTRGANAFLFLAERGKTPPLSEDQRKAIRTHVVRLFGVIPPARAAALLLTLLNNRDDAIGDLALRAVILGGLKIGPDLGRAIDKHIRFLPHGPSSKEWANLWTMYLKGPGKDLGADFVATSQVAHLESLRGSSAQVGVVTDLLRGERAIELAACYPRLTAGSRASVRQSFIEFSARLRRPLTEAELSLVEAVFAGPDADGVEHLVFFSPLVDVAKSTGDPRLRERLKTVAAAEADAEKQRRFRSNLLKLDE